MCRFSVSEGVVLIANTLVDLANHAIELFWY